MASAMSSEIGAAAQLPPAGWIYDPATAQTRWWDGVRWTEHVLPPESVAGTAPVYGFDPRQRPRLPSANGPAKASLILILIQLLGGLALFILGIAAGAASAQWWQFIEILTIISVLSFLMTIAAFVLAIIGTVIAVRRPTRKREAVFALVFTSLTIGWMILRSVVSIVAYGSL